MKTAAATGISTPILTKQNTFYIGPKFCSYIIVYINVMYKLIVCVYLMTNSHIGFACIMQVVEVSPFVSVKECQPMEAFH